MVREAADVVTWPELGLRTHECRLSPCTRWADGLLNGVPYCCDCADLVLERIEAVALRPDWRETLPDLADRAL